MSRRGLLWRSCLCPHCALSGVSLLLCSHPLSYLLISLPKLWPYPLCSDERAEAQEGTKTQHQGDLRMHLGPFDSLPHPGFGLSTGHTHTIAAKNILPVSKVCSNCTEKPHLDAEVGLRNADSPSVSPRGHTLASGSSLTLRESPPSSLTPCPFQNWVSLWRSPQVSCISLMTTLPRHLPTHTHFVAISGWNVCLY